MQRASPFPLCVFPQQKDEKQDHAASSSEGGKAEKAARSDPVQEYAADRGAQQDADGVGHGKPRLALHPVTGLHQVVDKVDHRHSVQSVARRFKDLGDAYFGSTVYGIRLKRSVDFG